jgi:aspartyl-tRNA(Asn)/glutamyl-tRNA(Gln) amidotransferase subunit C
MKIDRDTLNKLAHLARIEIESEDEAQLIKDMEQIVSWVEKLNELDVQDIEPLTHMSFEKNVAREDVSKNTLTREEALSNAPDHDESHYLVPKVLKK